MRDNIKNKLLKIKADIYKEILTLENKGKKKNDINEEIYYTTIKK